MVYTLPDFTLLSTGTDGGHYYLYTLITHQGQLRKLVVFFATKEDEQKIQKATSVTVEGNLQDEGPQHSLHLNDAKLLAWK
ncbi:hypothetical protein SAMN06265337_2494 [Hymenobacter gelipurpurascens]|uniref:Uncharacterized protein n=1 Tax=Hymenobacter gelipurpurascens TaxID=89968 RepID=A0A212U9G5_9BACT|nr:hypothetical protein [Hymenobacter gelipurpurascens]SNC74684.1 hypothetical protein SAMN06265337_2494 [Hymenobacter gelipurpurascens]